MSGEKKRCLHFYNREVKVVVVVVVALLNLIIVESNTHTHTRGGSERCTYQNNGCRLDYLQVSNNSV